MSSSTSTLGGSGGGGVTALTSHTGMLLSTMIGRSPMDVCMYTHASLTVEKEVYTYRYYDDSNYLSHRLS